MFQIYTDWANHYLEKARSKKVITDLQQDICDGVMLAEVIEAVSKYYNTSYIYICVWCIVCWMEVGCVKVV